MGVTHMQLLYALSFCHDYASLGLAASQHALLSLTHTYIHTHTHTHTHTLYSVSKCVALSNQPHSLTTLSLLQHSCFSWICS